MDDPSRRRLPGEGFWIQVTRRAWECCGGNEGEAGTVRVKRLYISPPPFKINQSIIYLAVRPDNVHIIFHSKISNYKKKGGSAAMIFVGIGSWESTC